MTQDRDARVKQLSRMRKDVLVDMYCSGIRSPDGRITRSLMDRSDIMKWRKEEVLNSIVAVEFGE